MKIAKPVLLAVTFFIAGCTAGGPAFSPVENPDINKALVYIYRPFNIVGFGVAPCVYIDEVKQGELKNNGYLVYPVDPGTRIIETKDGLSDPLTLYLDIVAGEEYYVRWSIDTDTNWGAVTHTYSLALIPKEYAAQEIKCTKKAR